MDLLHRQATWLILMEVLLVEILWQWCIVTMKIQTNIQEDGACDRLGMEKCDTFAQLESQDIIFSIHKIVLIKWLLCELAIILDFNRVCMFSSPEPKAHKVRL